MLPHLMCSRGLCHKSTTMNMKDQVRRRVHWCSLTTVCRNWLVFPPLVGNESGRNRPISDVRERWSQRDIFSACILWRKSEKLTINLWAWHCMHTLITMFLEGTSSDRDTSTLLLTMFIAAFTNNTCNNFCEINTERERERER